jgi:hypothetical protein
MRGKTMHRESMSQIAQRRAQTWEKPESPKWPTAGLTYEDTVRVRLIEEEDEEVALQNALGLQAHSRPMERVLFAIFSTCGRVCIG